MYFSYLGFVVVLYFTTVADGKAVREDYERYEQAHGSLKLHTRPAAWKDARLICFNEGAVLASPENDDLFMAMDDILSSRRRLPQVFTGISDTFSKGRFYSLQGISLAQMSIPWALGAPEDRSQSCLTLLPDGTLSDNECSEKYPFICYKKDPSPAGPATTSERDMSCESTGYHLERTIGSCYKFHKEGKYWKDAFAACVNEDAHLAIINSVEEANILKELFRNNFEGRQQNDVNDAAHIGFVDWGKKGGQWMTIQGQTLEEAGYATWHHGEPNNITNQFCGGMNIDGGLDDVNCYDGDKGYTRSFICEREPKPKSESESASSDNNNQGENDVISEVTPNSYEYLSTPPNEPDDDLDMFS